MTEASECFSIFSGAILSLMNSCVRSLRFFRHKYTSLDTLFSSLCISMIPFRQQPDGVLTIRSSKSSPCIVSSASIVKWKFRSINLLVNCRKRQLYRPLSSADELRMIKCWPFTWMRSFDSNFTRSLNHWTFFECFVWQVIVTMFDDFNAVRRWTEMDEIAEK